MGLDTVTEPLTYLVDDEPEDFDGQLHEGERLPIGGRGMARIRPGSLFPFPASP